MLAGCRVTWVLLLAAVSLPAVAQSNGTAPPAPMLLVDVDHRQTSSLNGDWHVIIDPYQTGLLVAFTTRYGRTATS